MWGKQGSGKSTTIKIIYHELFKRYIDPTHRYSFPLPGEISETLICNGIKVGIESLGDDLWYYGLNARLDNFIEIQNCDILICASRVHNNVAAHLKDLADTYGYRILKATNYRGDEPAFVHNNVNHLSAQHIVLVVDQIIAGTI